MLKKAIIALGISVCVTYDDLWIDYGSDSHPMQIFAVVIFSPFTFSRNEISNFVAPGPLADEHFYTELVLYYYVCLYKFTIETVFLRLVIFCPDHFFGNGDDSVHHGKWINSRLSV